MKKYDTIIVGAGAAGLFCGCALLGGENLILEKGKRPGLKLLMAGSGQCNVTHGGSIKDFLVHYGAHGKSVRGVLQRFNNLALCRMLSEQGVDTIEREDGKIFPKSMNGRDVLDALLKNVNADIEYGKEVDSIVEDDGFIVKAGAETYNCQNLVIATGGASYPTTGSDGKLATRISDELEVKLEELRPALTPVFVEGYPYSELSGISFRDIEISIGSQRAVGDILFTFKNLSGPVIINSSRYMKTGDTLVINYVWPMKPAELEAKLKKDFPGNNKSVLHYLIDELHLPKRFAKLLTEVLGFECKVSQLSGSQIKMIVAEVAAKSFKISGLAGFKEAMATAGGIDLSEISTKTMESKKYSGLYFIGEVLDVDGDTGGYNLQFAYSSACAAAEHINTKKTL